MKMKVQKVVAPRYCVVKFAVARFARKSLPLALYKHPFYNVIVRKGGDDMARNIFHIDMNCFYAAVELQRRPELRDKPVAVCGTQENPHGIVLTANYIAKPRGVKTGMDLAGKAVLP